MSANRDRQEVIVTDVAAEALQVPLPGLEGDSAASRKARGAFFTPKEVARFIASWGIRGPQDRVLEPSCGEAVFLLSAGQQLGQLRDSAPAPDQLHGVELHAGSVAAARRILDAAGLDPLLEVGDFFDHPADGSFDVVIGNPPYVRYQEFGGQARAKARHAALAQGVNLTGLSSSWAAFLIHASGCLKVGGRLGLVIPGELLNRNYAAAVRDFLLRRFAEVHLVTFEARVFPGVMEEVVLVLAEGSGGCDALSLHTARGLTDLRDLTLLDNGRRWAPSAFSRTWVQALLEPAAVALYERVAASPSFVTLGTWGSPRLGMVTGANRFFALSAVDVRQHALAADEVQAISPPGSRHLRALTFGATDWHQLRDQGARAYLFRPATCDEHRLSKGARRYLAEGEESGVAAAYKCRMRDPWWQVPAMAPPDLLVTYMNHEAVQLATNAAGVHCLNSVHGIRLQVEHELGRGLLPLAAMNSLTLLSGELVGRAFGGGMLQVLPREAARLVVPSPEAVRDLRTPLERIKPRVRTLLGHGRVEDAAAVVDQVVLSDTGLLAPHEIDRLFRARASLYRRRLLRSS